MIRGIALLALLAVVALGFTNSDQTPQDDKRPHVRVAHPQRKTVYRKLNVPGEVLPNQQIDVYARVPGYLEKMHVDRGSWVQQGAPLFKIAVPDLQKQLAKEEADFKAADAGVARDKATRTWRLATYRRTLDARHKTPDLVTQEALDDAEGHYLMAKADVKLAKAHRASLQAAAERTRTLIGFATVAAPFAGVVTERWVDEGELIQPGTTKLVHLMQIDPIRVRVHAPAPDVPSVRADSQVRLSFDELPDWKPDPIPVSRTSWALKTTTKTLAVEIDVPNPDKNIRPGMFARVSLELDAHPNALVLAAGALVVEKQKRFVFVVRNGVAAKVEVKIGFDDGIEFDVTEGLSDEDDVIVDGKNLVSEGEPVRTSRK